MAGIVGTVAESVGLQLLLQPASSAVVFRAACSVVGVVYPAYESLKTVESGHLERHQAHQRRDAQWLMYWAVYATFEVVERHTASLVTWVPYYWHVKLGFLLWLQLPSFQGARRLYMRVSPLLRRHQPAIDSTIQALQESLVRPEMVKAAEGVRASLCTVPILGWLLRTPAEDEAILWRSRTAGGVGGGRSSDDDHSGDGGSRQPGHKRRRATAPSPGRLVPSPEGSGSSQWDYLDDRPGQDGSREGSGEGTASWPARLW
eukprot:CAMPEP_0206151438 /NCGR_PEP_ID=MMETSP1473-20131121/38824_1 /ASSEMBLY_ACC=CAM_ASM_001109 /TAXON_ID=1461547 /ORGANISM="Stichococcus sp, Strain RCC1054" /LENGTH=259 /DNA_ID=CAMNT_0053548985 /DNA_START=191 /DNA_END=967 /DNA_ORIENTATION=+